MDNLNRALSMICRFVLRCPEEVHRNFMTTAEASAKPGSLRQVAAVCALVFLAMTMHCRDASAQGFDGFGGAEPTVVWSANAGCKTIARNGI